jgi:hypothetical protein
LIRTVAGPVARKWAASFGLGEGKAVTRLEAALATQTRDRIASQDGVIDFERTLDEAAYGIVTGWLEAVLGGPVAHSAQTFSATRLAFLMAKGDGAWSEVFLDPDVARAELRAAMGAAYVMATPPIVLRKIERQSL